MAVALILAADMEENVVVGGVAASQHIRTHRKVPRCKPPL